MKDRPLVSVIIPTYNRAAYVRETLESVLEQTYTPVEIIVVDDGSRDATREIIMRCGKNVCYVYQQNSGISAARNRGIAEARGELIAFLDDDDKWLPEKLTKQVEYLKSNENISLVHTNFLLWDSDKNLYKKSEKDRSRYKGHCADLLFLETALLLSTSLLRRECLDQVGVFDETIRHQTAEDTDLWLRIAEKFELGYLDDYLMLYRIHGGNAVGHQVDPLSVKMLRINENELYVFKKALQRNPRYLETIGQQRVHQRLFALAFGAGYGYFDRGQLSEARRYFGEALYYCPTDRRTRLLYWATAFPAVFIRRLRQVKRIVPTVLAETLRV